MAIIAVPGGTVLTCQIRTGTDEQGNPITKNLSFSNVKATATDQDIFDTAVALTGLQDSPLTAVSKKETTGLLQG